jgi:hypothetical protein
MYSQEHSPNPVGLQRSFDANVWLDLWFIMWEIGIDDNIMTCFQVWVYEGLCVVWWRWGDIVCWPVYRYEYTKVCVKCGEGEVTDFLCVCVFGGGGVGVVSYSGM